MTLAGHLWTVATRLRQRARPPCSPSWSTSLEDSRYGSVRLTGELAVPPDARGLVVLVHGLGGCSESGYMMRQAAAVTGRGLACLRLNLRGADRRGEDFYHAGLVEDLEATLASREVAPYEEIFLWGNSLGGHTVLRWALAPTDPRVRAVAAVSSPLDLFASSRSFAMPSRWPYRRYVLKALRDIYAAVAARREVPLSVEKADRIRGLREWDEKIVAPRHGFADADDYYQRMSVAPQLRELAVPALYVGSEADPMVPADTVRPALSRASPSLQQRWTPRGGHMAFPGKLDLGLGADLGLEGQVLHWLLNR